MPHDGERIPQVPHGAVSVPPVHTSYCQTGLYWRLELTRPLLSNLMAPDDMKNLGFAEDDKPTSIPRHAGGSTAHSVRDDGKKIS